MLSMGSPTSPFLSPQSPRSPLESNGFLGSHGLAQSPPADGSPLQWFEENSGLQDFAMYTEGSESSHGGSQIEGSDEENDVSLQDSDSHDQAKGNGLTDADRAAEAR